MSLAARKNNEVHFRFNVGVLCIAQKN